MAEGSLVMQSNNPDNATTPYIPTHNQGSGSLNWNAAKAVNNANSKIGSRRFRIVDVVPEYYSTPQGNDKICVFGGTMEGYSTRSLLSDYKLRNSAQ